MRIVQGIDQFLRILLFDQESVVPRNHAPVRTLYRTHKFTGLLYTVFQFYRGWVRIIQAIVQSLIILLFDQLSTVPGNCAPVCSLHRPLGLLENTWTAFNFPVESCVSFRVSFNSPKYCHLRWKFGSQEIMRLFVHWIVCIDFRDFQKQITNQLSRKSMRQGIVHFDRFQFFDEVSRFPGIMRLSRHYTVHINSWDLIPQPETVCPLIYAYGWYDRSPQWVLILWQGTSAQHAKVRSLHGKFPVTDFQ